MPQNSQALRERKERIPTKTIGYKRKPHSHLLPAARPGKAPGIFFTHFFFAQARGARTPSAGPGADSGPQGAPPNPGNLQGQCLGQGLSPRRQKRVARQKWIRRAKRRRPKIRQPCRIVRHNRHFAIIKVFRSTIKSRPKYATIKSPLFSGFSDRIPESRPIQPNWRPCKVWPDSWITPSKTAALALVQSKPHPTSSSRAHSGRMKDQEDQRERQPEHTLCGHL